MSGFVVSARKYRPMRFDEVVGQDHVSNTLKNALKTDHLGHSFLFCGPRGVGKTTSARILAKVLNCENRTEDFEPCNSCSSCSAFNKNSSFNIYELDAASNNGVDHIRELVEQVRFAPQQGKYKVYIIDEVHMLSASAFNAFLKTLEEPPSYAVFILATTEKHKILPTILSRCQIYDFHRVTVNDMVSHLQEICVIEGVQAQDSALHVIAQKADGALRDALSMFDRIVSFTGNTITYDHVIEALNILDYDTFFALTKALIIQDKNTVLQLFNKVNSKGFDGDQIITGLAEHFRNLLVSQDSELVHLLEVAPEIKEKYLQQANLVQFSFLLNAINIANQCDIHYRQAKNKRLHVELALLKMCFLGNLSKNVPYLSNEAVSEKKTLDLNKESSSLPIKEVNEPDAISEQAAIDPAEQLVKKQDELIESSSEKQKNPSDFHLSNIQHLINEQQQTESIQQTKKQAQNPVGKVNFNDLISKKDAIEKAWILLETHYKTKGKQVMENLIRNSQLEFTETQLIVHTTQGVEEQLFEKNYYEIIDFIKSETGLESFSFSTLGKEIDTTIQSFTKEDQLEYLKTKNPSIIGFCKTFDLQIDYKK